MGGLTYCVFAWLIGVTAFSLRALGGYIVLRRLVRAHCEPLTVELRNRCLSLQERLGVQRAVRYLQSGLVEAPAVVGWFRPAVLIPVSALTGLSSSQLEAVIAHELAHIKRLDCFVNLFQIAIEAVWFYHPEFWWVNRQILSERENCCDDVAVTISGEALSYARALAVLEDLRQGPAWALGANSGSVKERVRRILGMDAMTRSVPQAGLAVVASLFVAGAILGAASFGRLFAQETRQEPVQIQTLATPPVTKPEFIAPKFTEPAQPKIRITKAPEIAAVKVDLPEPPEVADPVEPPEPPDVPDDEEKATEAQTDNHGSYIEGLQSSGLKNLTVDDLIALKVQGVSPEYVREMRAAGFKTSVGDLIAMKVQGVSPDYVKELRAAGLKNLNVGQIVALKVQGISPAQAGEFGREFGLSDVSVGQIVAFKVQGITPEYIRGLREAGLKDLSTGQIIAAKVQGITPEFVRKVRDHGFTDLTVDQLIRLKVTGVF